MGAQCSCLYYRMVATIWGLLLTPRVCNVLAELQLAASQQHQRPHALHLHITLWHVYLLWQVPQQHPQLLVCPNIAADAGAQIAVQQLA
jgi:hypothetical protein